MYRDHLIGLVGIDTGANRVWLDGEGRIHERLNYVQRIMMEKRTFVSLIRPIQTKI